VLSKVSFPRTRRVRRVTPQASLFPPHVDTDLHQGPKFSIGSLYTQNRISTMPHATPSDTMSDNELPDAPSPPAEPPSEAMHISKEVESEDEFDRVDEVLMSEMLDTKDEEDDGEEDFLLSTQATKKESTEPPASSPPPLP
jgi:hypothetical protein